MEKARKRSPEKCEPLVPVRARPEVTRRAKAWHWCGNSGASVATTAMTEPAPGGGRSEVGHRVVGGEVVAERDPGQHELAAGAEVGLDEHADRVGRPGRTTTREAVPEPPLNS